MQNPTKTKKGARAKNADTSFTYLMILGPNYITNYLKYIESIKDLPPLKSIGNNRTPPHPHGSGLT